MKAFSLPIFGIIVAFAISGCGSTSQGSGTSTESTSAPQAVRTVAPVSAAQSNDADSSATEQPNDSDDQDDSGDPPAVVAAKNNTDCSEQSVTNVSEDDRVLVLDDGNRYLIPDEYQDTTSTWMGDTVYYCDGGPGHRYFVNEDGDSVPVGALDE
jgi:hypothetical protein